jgi:plasmid stabilization system protein ParE
VTARIVYSLRARQSLREIVLFVAEHRPEAALRLVDDVERRLEKVLGVFPEAGARMDDGTRFVVVRNHSVLYRFDPSKDEVVVVDVFGPGMDWR